MRRRKVVQAAGGEELILRPENRRWLRVRDNDVVPSDLRRVNGAGAGDAFGQQSQQVLAGGVAEPEDRVHVLLLVQREALIHRPVQMDGQLRKAQERARWR